MEATLVEQFESETYQSKHLQRLCSLLIERLHTATEQERHHLAGVLHDDALQLGCQIERLLSDVVNLSALPPQTQELLREAVHLTNALLGELRGVVNELYPAPIAMIGLSQAIQTLLQNLERRSGLHCSWRCDARTESRCEHLGTEQEDILYHISREAIINAVKHACATTLNVTLSSDSTHLQLHIQDNGVGFVLPSVSDLLTRGHLGLALLQERTQHIQGSLRIETEVHGGTTLIIRVPLNCHIRDREEGKRWQVV